MKEFNYQSGPEMTEALAGKAVKGVEILDGKSGHDKLVFHFEDGTQLVIEYDWIYEWGLVEKNSPAPLIYHPLYN